MGAWAVVREMDACEGIGTEVLVAVCWIFVSSMLPEKETGKDRIGTRPCRNSLDTNSSRWVRSAAAAVAVVVRHLGTSARRIEIVRLRWQ